MMMNLSISSLNNVQLFIKEEKDYNPTNNKGSRDNTLKKLNLNN